MVRDKQWISQGRETMKKMGIEEATLNFIDMEKAEISRIGTTRTRLDHGEWKLKVGHIKESKKNKTHWAPVKTFPEIKEYFVALWKGDAFQSRFIVYNMSCLERLIPSPAFEEYPRNQTSFWPLVMYYFTSQPHITGVSLNLNKHHCENLNQWAKAQIAKNSPDECLQNSESLQAPESQGAFRTGKDGVEPTNRGQSSTPVSDNTHNAELQLIVAKTSKQPIPDQKSRFEHVLSIANKIEKLQQQKEESDSRTLALVEKKTTRPKALLLQYPLLDLYTREFGIYMGRKVDESTCKVGEHGEESLTYIRRLPNVGALPTRSDSEPPESMLWAMYLACSGQWAKYLGEDYPSILQRIKDNELILPADTKVNIFVFHGKEDTVVPESTTKEFVDLVKHRLYGGNEEMVHYEVVPEENHGFDYEFDIAASGEKNLSWLKNIIHGIGKVWQAD